MGNKDWCCFTLTLLMKTLRIGKAIHIAWLLAYCFGGACAENLPPGVSIIWPKERMFPFGGYASIKIRAAALDPDGTVAKVSFFAGCNMIGEVTHPPYDLIWNVSTTCPCPDSFRLALRAVAEDNLGAQAESKPVTVWYSLTRPSFSFVDILAPTNGSLFAEPADFVFSAEVMANGIEGSMEFFVGDQSVGLVESTGLLTPPASVTVSNLLEGEYKLQVNYDGGDGCQNCFMLTNTIRVVKLGIASPRRTPAGHAQFDVVTSFPGRDTIIEASPDLENWMPLATNVPVSTAFIFTDTTSVSTSNWFYRARVPAE